MDRENISKLFKPKWNFFNSVLLVLFISSFIPIIQGIILEIPLNIAFKLGGSNSCGVRNPFCNKLFDIDSIYMTIKPLGFLYVGIWILFITYFVSIMHNIYLFYKKRL